LAASSGIQPAPDGLGHLTERFERKLVAMAVQPLQIRQGSRLFFARRRSSSAYANRQNPLIQRKYLFQPNIDSPVGYEVILVAERFPSVHSEARERHCMRVVIEADAAQIGNPVIPAMNAKTMQMFPAPVQASLNVWMELSDHGLTATSKRRQIIGLIPASTSRN
jgi:hypothetical protein